MKILIVNFEYPPLGGGGGVATEQIAEELAARHQVHVITSGFKDLGSEEEIEGVRVHRVPAWGRKDLSAASFLSLLMFVPTALWRGWRLCQEIPFDVINAQFVLPSGVVAVALAKAFKVPLVVSFIGGDLYDPSKTSSPHRFGALRALVRWIAKEAQALTAISEDTKRRAQELHGVSGKITVVPVGYWPAEVPMVGRAELGLPEGRTVLISVGRLIARKRFERLLEMLAVVPEVELVVVGEGARRPSLESLAASLQVAERVHFMGFVSEEKKTQLLRVADIYVSAAEHEGFGIVFLEAMAAGLPVVAVRNGGQEDFLQEGHNGLLVARSEADLLAEAVKRLVGDTEMRERMGRANQEEVIEYTAGNVAERFEQVLLEVTGRRV